MSWYLWVIPTAAVAAASVLIVVGRRRRRAARTPEEQLRAARSAVRSIRRDSPRPNRDIFERGKGVPDRHSGPIAENAAYGDAASFGGGGGGSD